MDKMSLIFVSHSHRDNDWCREFVRELRKRGADVWYDEQSLGFGRLSEAITREMLSRPVFIPIFTPAAVGSKWVQREMDAAIYLQDKDADRVVLPVIAARCDVPPLWVTFRRVSGPDDAPLAAKEAAAQVAEALHLGVAETTANANASTVSSPLEPPTYTGPHSAPVQGSGKQVLTAQPGFRLFAHTITDVYDADLKRSLVVYPAWLVGGLILTGLIAFLLAGSLATAADQAPSHAGTASWPLYIWLGLLGLTLEATILRHPSLRRYELMMMGVSIVILAVVGIAVYDGPLFQPPLGILSNVLLLRPNSVVFALVNFGILAMFMLLSTRRWIRRVNGLPISRPRVELGMSVVPSDVREPALTEIVFGDLIAGGVVALVLATLLRVEVLNGVAQALQVGSRIDPCAVAWPFGRCMLTSLPRQATRPPTLAQVNLIFALILIVLGLLLAALRGLFSGLGGLTTADPGVRSLGYDTRSVSAEVAVTILATLRSSLDRLFRLSMQGGALAIRDIAWPSLIVIWTVSTAATSFALLTYLVPTSACLLPSCVTARLTTPAIYMSMGLALAWGAVAVCALTSAAGFLVFSRRVVTNTLRFVVRVAAHFLLAYWLLFVALTALGQGLTVSRIFTVKAPTMNPFLFVDPLALASLAIAFMGGQVLLFQRLKRFYDSSAMESA